MPFNIIGFLAGRAIAENAGVDRQRATQLAVLPSALNLPLPLSLITTRVIAQREAPVAVNAPPGTTPPADPNLRVVPSLIGQPQADAKKTLQSMGFTNVVTANVASAPGDKGKVVEQSVAANSTIAKDAPLILIIGAGVPPIIVPRLLGLSFAVAKDILNDAGLIYAVSEPEFNNLPEDHVIKQVPAPGEEAPENNTVTLTLSLGAAGNVVKDKVEVPKLISMHVDVATKTVAEKGFKVDSIERIPADTVPKDHVIEQKPEPFKVVDPQTPILLIVSLGPEG